MTTEEQTEQKRDLLRKYIGAGSDQSSSMGINHLAIFARDLEATADFYANVLGMPVVRVTANRDEPGSTHMNVDIGNGVSLAFFDFPHVPRIQVPPEEGVGGMMHVAIAMREERYQEVEGRLNQHGVAPMRIGNSVYLKDPNGTNLELMIVKG